MQNININKILNFENEIDDLLLISIDDQIETIFDKEGVKITGKILIGGKAKEKEEEKEFNDAVDIDIFLTHEEIFDQNKLNVSVNDFTYNIENNKLILNITLKIEGLKEIETTFLTEENNETIEQEDIEQDVIEEYIDIIEEENREVKEEVIDSEPIKKGLLRTVFSSKKIKEEVSWKLHCVKEEKTYEEIAAKYNINIDKLKKINKGENLESGKLIFIPLD